MAWMRTVTGRLEERLEQMREVDGERAPVP